MFTSATSPTSRPNRQALRRLAESQYGLFTRDQALALGVSHNVITHGAAVGEWTRIYPRVYAIEGLPKSWQQSLLGACLSGGPGTCASHRAAAALWRLDTASPGPLEISALRNLRYPKPGLIIHHTLLPAADILRIDRIPVTTLSRTLFDVAAVVTRSELEAILDSAIRRRPTVLDELVERVANARGRPRGIALLRDVLRERPAAETVVGSPLEGRMLKALAKAGLPPPRRQFEIYDDHELVARVDFVYPEWRIVLEVDGYRWHSGKRAWQSDLERRNRLEGLGWHVLNVTQHELDQGCRFILRQIESLRDLH